MPRRPLTIPNLPTDPFIAEFKSFLRVECGLSDNTLKGYLRDLRDLITDLGKDPAPPGETNAPVDVLKLFTSITPRQLSEHIGRLKTDKNLTGSSVIRHLATIRVLYRYLVSTERLKKSPADLLERPTRWKKLPNVLTPGQMKKLLEAPGQAAAPGAVEVKILKASNAGEEGAKAPSSRTKKPQTPAGAPLHLRDRAMLELLYACGLRASEVCTLRIDDLKPTLGVIIVTGKGNKQRMVPIGKPAQKAVEEYMKRCRPTLARAKSGDTLLLSRSGRPLERVAVWQLVKKNAKAAGLNKVHPHALRHSFATHLLSGGADLRVVQELLGHADIGTTEIYTHVDRTHLKDVHRKFHPRG